MKEFGTRQKAFERRQMLSSAAAYALFALLAGRAALFLSGARTAAADSERDKAVAELKALTRSVDKARAEQAAVAAAHRSAAEAYRMMTDLPGERRLEGVTALAKMDQSKLDPFERQALVDRAAALRHELGQAAFERGKDAFRKNDWAAATDEFSRSLTMEPSGSQQLEASFRLGAALVRQHKYEPAIAPLKTFLEMDRGSKNREAAMSLLAQAYAQTGNREQAVAVVRETLPVKGALSGAEVADARVTTRRRTWWRRLPCRRRLLRRVRSPPPQRPLSEAMWTRRPRAGPRRSRPSPSPPPVSCPPRRRHTGASALTPWPRPAAARDVLREWSIRSQPALGTRPARATPRRRRFEQAASVRERLRACPGTGAGWTLPPRAGHRSAKTPT